MIRPRSGRRGIFGATDQTIGRIDLVRLAWNVLRMYIWDRLARVPWIFDLWQTLSMDRRRLLVLECNRFIDELRATRIAQDPKRIGGYDHQVYSQTGADGILAEIFRRIGTTNRTF